MPVRGAREQRLGEAAGERVFSVDTAFSGTQHLHRNGGEPVIAEQPLMCGGMVGLDEGLMALLQLCGGTGEGELIVIQAALDVEVCFHEVLVTFTLGTVYGLMLDLQPIAYRFKVVRGVVATTI